FGLVGLVIAFLQYRKKQDGLISTALEPAVGKNKIIKDGIDSFAVIATVMGIATSLGIGILQMGGGLEALFGFKNGIPLQVIINLVGFVADTLSSATGIAK